MEVEQRQVVKVSHCTDYVFAREGTVGSSGNGRRAVGAVLAADLVDQVIHVVSPVSEIVGHLQVVRDVVKLGLIDGRTLPEDDIAGPFVDA